MIATRNDTNSPESACDAVAEALKQMDESPASYASVKRIWDDAAALELNLNKQQSD